MLIDCCIWWCLIRVYTVCADLPFCMLWVKMVLLSLFNIFFLILFVTPLPSCLTSVFDSIYIFITTWAWFNVTFIHCCLMLLLKWYYCSFVTTDNDLVIFFLCILTTYILTLYSGYWHPDTNVLDNPINIHISQVSLDPYFVDVSLPNKFGNFGVLNVTCDFLHTFWI